MAPPTREQSEKLKQFRVRIKDLKLTGKQNTDQFLLRWIQATPTLEESEQMLRKSLKWRAKIQIDKIEQWRPPEFLKPFLQHVDMEGVDKENRPVMIYDMGKWPIQEAIDLGQEESLFKALALLLERVNKKMEGKKTKDGEPVDQFIAIRDFSTVSFNRPHLSLLTAIGRVPVEHYPGQLKTLYVVNAWLPFLVMMKYITPLSQRFFRLQKMGEEWVTYGKNEEEWKKALKEVVAPDQLPQVLGGTRKSVYKPNSSCKI